MVKERATYEPDARTLRMMLISYFSFPTASMRKPIFSKAFSKSW